MNFKQALHVIWLHVAPEKSSSRTQKCFQTLCKSDMKASLVFLLEGRQNNTGGILDSFHVTLQRCFFGKESTNGKREGCRQNWKSRSTQACLWVLKLRALIDWLEIKKHRCVSKWCILLCYHQLTGTDRGSLSPVLIADYWQDFLL